MHFYSHGKNHIVYLSSSDHLRSDEQDLNCFLIFKSRGNYICKFKFEFIKKLVPVYTGIAKGNSNLCSKPQKVLQRDNDVKIEKLTL